MLIDVHFRLDTAKKRRERMKSIVSKVAVHCWVLLLASISRAIAQSQSDNSILKMVEYRPGQAWITDHSITVTILAIEDVHKVGKVVHVRIDKIPFQSKRPEWTALTSGMGHFSGYVRPTHNRDCLTSNPFNLSLFGRAFFLTILNRHHRMMNAIRNKNT
jgi:hypothetical protein